MCRGDWIGGLCEHSLLRDTEYLPKFEPATWPGRCEQGQWWVEGERALQRHMVRLHSPDGACTAQGAVVFATRMHGLGAQVHYLTECLTSAVVWGKGMLVGGNVTRSISCGRTRMLGGHDLAHELYSCYLEPALACDAPAEERSGGQGMQGGEGGGEGGEGEKVNPALEERLRDFNFAREKRREKYGENGPWGILALYDHLGESFFILFLSLSFSCYIIRHGVLCVRARVVLSPLAMACISFFDAYFFFRPHPPPHRSYKYSS